MANTMNTLSIIWVLCFILVGLVGILTSFLIGIRVVSHYLEQHSAKRREHLFAKIFACLRGTTSREELKQALKPTDQHFLAKSTHELLKSIQGKDRSQLIDLLVFLDIPDHIATIASQGPLQERLEAIANLVYFTDPCVVIFLHALLDDRVHDIRIEAARTLIETSSLQSVDLLFEKLDLTLGTQVLVLQNTFRQLTVDAAPRLLEILSAMHAGPTAEANKVLIVETLGHLRYTKGVPMLLPLAQESSPQVRMAFFRCLPEFWIPSAIPIIFKGLEDSHWQVRAQAARCVGQLRMIEAIQWLARLMEDETEWESQYAAGCALVALGSQGIAILQALARGTGRGQEMAKMVLAEKNGGVSNDQTLAA